MLIKITANEAIFRCNDAKCCDPMKWDRNGTLKFFDELIFETNFNGTKMFMNSSILALTGSSYQMIAVNVHFLIHVDEEKKKLPEISEPSSIKSSLRMSVTTRIAAIELKFNGNFTRAHFLQQPIITGRRRHHNHMVVSCNMCFEQCINACAQLFGKNKK